MPENPEPAHIDFSHVEIELWTPDHIECGRGFQCERKEFEEYWNDDLPDDVKGHVGRAWIIRIQGNLAGYITLCTDALTKKVKGEQKRYLASEGIHYGSIPAIKIGRLARGIQAKGAGRRLMDWALIYIATELAPRVGVRFVTVDALYDGEDHAHIYDVSWFYAEYGFQYVDPEKNPTPKTRYRSMYLDIKAMVDEFAVKP